MMPLELLASMQVKDWSVFRHHLQYHHEGMFRKGPNGMKPLELLADMQVKDWS